MLKKLSVVILALTLILSAVPVWAANDASSLKTDCVSQNQDPVIYSSTLKVTEDGGVYKVGFVEIEFKKNFIDPSQLPDTISVEISAVDGVPGIEFSPDISQFDKDVMIKVDSYRGLLYDKTSGKNIRVDIRKQHIRAEHFSRYAFS